MTQTTDKNVGHWLRYLNTIAVRWVNQSAAVVVDGVDQMSDGEHTVSSCFKTATRLADIALLNGVEYAVTALAGPGFKMLPLTVASSWYAVPNAPSAYSVSVSLTEPLSRDLADDRITIDRIGFEAKIAGVESPCTESVLPAGAAEFRIVLSRLGLHGGCYTGKVVLTPVPPATGNPVSVDVDIEL